MSISVSTSPASVPDAASAGGAFTARYSPPPALVWLTLLLCVACAACTPYTYYFADVLRFANWAQATHGTAPWAAYSQPDCNYPAIPLYILTITEKIRLAAHAPRLGALELALFKLPVIVSIFGGVAVCYYGLRARLGERYAQYAAAAYGSCAALWFNTCVWGQNDAILCLGMVAALVALINDRPGWCGIALGLALEVKLQPTIIMPAIGIYWLARRDWKAIALGMLGAAGAWAALAAPFFLAGAGTAFMSGYTGSYNLFSLVDVSAWNGWFLVHHIGGHLLHLKHADSDQNKLLRLITFKQVGNLVYAAYLSFLFIGLWRRPTRYNGVLACAVSAFAFFMLPCDIHERYLLMAVILLPVLVPATARSRSKSAYALFAALSVVALLEQFVYCEFNPGAVENKITHLQLILTMKIPVGVPITLFDLALFVWASVMYWREVYKAPADAPDLFAPGAPQTA